MERLSSSLRVVGVEETRRRLRADAARLGISRVTGITALDVLGIPAFSSVRLSGARNAACSQWLRRLRWWLSRVAGAGS